MNNTKIIPLIIFDIFALLLLFYIIIIVILKSNFTIERQMDIFHV